METFFWSYGKGDVRHWAEALKRCAMVLENVGRDAAERALLRSRDERTAIDEERAKGNSEVFAAVRWILRFMDEVCDNCVNKELFEHGAAVTWLLAVPEVSSSAARLLATMSRRLIAGRPTKNEYFSTTGFEGVKIALGNASVPRRSSRACSGTRQAETVSGKKFRIKFELRRVDGDVGEGSARRYDVITTFVLDMHNFEDSHRSGVITNEFTIASATAASVEMVEFFHPSTPTGKFLAAEYGAIKSLNDSDEIAELAIGVFAAYYEFMHHVRTLFAPSDDESFQRREREAWICIGAQIVLHTKTKDMNPYSANGHCQHQVIGHTKETVRTALELLDTDRNLVGVGVSTLDESQARKDAINVLSAYVNERQTGYLACEVIRRSDSLRILSKVVGDLVSQLVESKLRPHFELISEVRCLMNLIGILSTSQPGCSAIKDAEIMRCLVKLLEDDVPEHLPILCDVVHTIESYLDFSQNEVAQFRELNGIEMLLARLRRESLASLEELKMSGFCSESDRKRKAQSMELDDGGETSGRSSPCVGEMLHSVSYPRRVLLKALMRTLAYTSFAVGGSRSRVPGLADGTLTETLAIILRNTLVFGPGVSSLAANLLCDIIHNEPTCYATLDGAGIIDAYLLFITTGMWRLSASKNMSKVLCAVPTTLNAISLNESGQEKVIATGAISCFRRMMNDVPEVMNAETAKIIGSALNELIRHSPALKDEGVKCILSILRDATLTSCSTNFVFASKEVVEQMDATKRLHSVARFMDGVFQTSHLCQPLLDQGAFEIMIDLICRPAPVLFSKCSGYQALMIACKSLVNPPDANSFAINSPPDVSVTAERACRTMCTYMTRMANECAISLDNEHKQLIDLVFNPSVDWERYRTFDIYSTSDGDERSDETAWCARVKQICSGIVGFERSCELMTSLVVVMPAMLLVVVDKITLPAAFKAFSSASKIEGILRDLSASIDADRERYSPFRWLYNCSENLMRTTSALFAALAKLSTTMRRRKDLGPSRKDFIALTSELCWRMTLNLKLNFGDLFDRKCAKDASREEINWYQRALQGLLAVTYETFFDDRRNSPNGAMINYAARSGLFAEILRHFESTMECAHHNLVATEGNSENAHQNASIAKVAECYTSLRCFAKMFDSIADVKHVAAGAPFKLALACDTPGSLEAHLEFPDMSAYLRTPDTSHIPDAFYTNRSAMDWIHCSLNVSLQCLWDPKHAALFEFMPAESADSFLNCFLHILNGTVPAAVVEQPRPSPPPRPVPTPAPARYVPSPDMMRAIMEMGFSEGHAHHAITAVRGRSIESAMEYLFTNPMDSVSNVAPVHIPEPMSVPEATTNDKEPSNQPSDATSQSSLNRPHAVKRGQMPDVRNVVSTLYAMFLCSAEKAAQVIFEVINQHELSGMSREHIIQLAVKEILRDRITGRETDSVYECKLYAFISSLAKQGDDATRRALWGDSHSLKSQLGRFCSAVRKMKNRSLADLPMSFVTMTNCINTSACLQKVSGDGTFAKFGFLSETDLLNVTESCIECLDNIFAEQKEKGHEFKSNSVTSAILDLLANISRHEAVASRLLGESIQEGQTVMRTLFYSFWNSEQESVSVIMRHVANDTRSLQAAVELEIVKSITKPPLGRDHKVALKTFTTAMKQVIERDFEIFVNAFKNVADITNSNDDTSADRCYVVPQAKVKELQSFPEGKPSEGLRAVVDVLVGVVVEDIRRSATVHELERQAAAYRLLTELVEANPACIKMLLKIDESAGLFSKIMSSQLPISQHSTAPGVWIGAENVAFFLATVCVTNAKARYRIIEGILKIFADDAFRAETAPYHALMDLLHALMDFGLARGYQSGEKIQNRAVFNLQQGVVKTMYQLKVPEKLVALIRKTELATPDVNQGFLRVTLYVLESLIVRSSRSKRRDRLTRIRNAIRANVNISGGEGGNEAAVAMIESLLTGGARGHVQVTRVFNSGRNQRVVADVPVNFGASEMDDDNGAQGDDEGRELTESELSQLFARAHDATLGDMSVDEDTGDGIDDGSSTSDDSSSDDDDLDEDDEDHSMEEDDEDEHFDEPRPLHHESEDHEIENAFHDDIEDGEDEENESEGTAHGEDEDDDEDEDEDDEDEDDEGGGEDDGLYDDDDVDAYDAFEPMTDDEDYDDEEGDFEEPAMSALLLRHTPTSESIASGIIPPTQHPFNFGQSINSISIAQVEQWLATDYSTIMSGVDPRSAARSISELQTFDRRASTNIRSIRVVAEAETVPLVNGTERPMPPRIVPPSTRRSSNIWATSSTEAEAASADESAAQPLPAHANGVNVQRVGQALNITLTTPVDANARTRSLQDVLTSISGEMARLAVRPGHMMEFLDPLSSAKAILWLGTGGYQPQSPNHFRVRDQAPWSLDGRHARSRFWSNAICMSVGESISSNISWLFGEGTKSQMCSPTGAAGKAVATTEVGINTVSDQQPLPAPQEAIERLRVAATELGIDPSVLALLPVDLRESFVNANRLVAEALAVVGQDSEARSSISPIDAEFIVALPPDLQSEIIRTTTAAASRLIGVRTPAVVTALPPAVGASSQLMRHFNSSFANWARDTNRIGRDSNDAQVDKGEYKPFTCVVGFDESDIRTLLNLLRTDNNDIRDSATKVCASLAVAESNRDILLRLVFEMVFDSDHGCNSTKLDDRLETRTNDANTMRIRFLTLLQLLITRNKHVSNARFVTNMSVRQIEEACRGVTPLCDKEHWLKLASKEESAQSLEVSDFSILVLLLRIIGDSNFQQGKVSYATYRDDEIAISTVSCLESYLSKQSKAFTDHWEPQSVYQHAIPKCPELVCGVINTFGVVHLSSAMTDKIHNILKHLSSACPHEVTMAIIESLHVRALECASILSEVSLQHHVSWHMETRDDRVRFRSKRCLEAPLVLLRLTKCLIFMLTHISKENKEHTSTTNPFDKRSREQLVRFYRMLSPVWDRLTAHAEKLKQRVSDDEEVSPPRRDPLAAPEDLHHGTMESLVTAYLMITSSLLPFLEDERSQNRRHSVAGILSPSRVQSPAFGLRSSHASLSTMTRASSHALDALTLAQGENASVAAMISDMWKFVEAHRDVLNRMVKASPQLLAGPFKVLLQSPRLIDFENKRNHVRSQIKKLRDKVGRSNNQLKIRREHILQDSYNQLRMRSVAEMRSKLSIVFVNEEGVDGGGLIREWFTILAREIFNPNIALFELSHDKGCYQPNPNSIINEEHLLYFRFVGRLVAKAMFDDILLSAYFTRPIYKHILGLPLTYDDIEGVDPDYYKSLKWMLENSIDGVFDYTFSETTSFFGETQVHDLIEDGRLIPVTDENKFEYVNLVTAHRMTNAVKHQVAAFVKGFEEIIPRETISILNAAELELLISGTPDIDIEDLRANTEYHGYTVGSKQIQWFWDVVREMSKDDLARLLMFTTGTSKVPLDGFSGLQGMQGPQKFQIHRQHADDQKLPSAHTCFNQLDLHEYSSKNILRDRLMYAIENCSEGFGFV